MLPFQISILTGSDSDWVTLKTLLLIYPTLGTVKSDSTSLRVGYPFKYINEYDGTESLFSGLDEPCSMLPIQP